MYRTSFLLPDFPNTRIRVLRFNNFEGSVPSQLFDKPLDALFLNDNRLRFGIPKNLRNSPVSVLVFVNNNLGGCIPGSIGKMGKTSEIGRDGGDEGGES
ncbi:unnamed protein product [Linum trigynum]|uniref:Uncharacterized protein n=1 Tax=Linum trigynum TaxID=586398 RepID=A0AAV2FWF5_9ROSI